MGGKDTSSPGGAKGAEPSAVCEGGLFGEGLDAQINGDCGEGVECQGELPSVDVLGLQKRSKGLWAGSG